MEWKFYDEEEFEDELSELGAEDRAKLVYLMERFLTTGPKHPVFVEDYRGGLFCMRHTKGAYKGRCLFFTERRGDPVALLVYRKESAKADPRAIERARNRKAEYENNYE